MDRMQFERRVNPLSCTFCLRTFSDFTCFHDHAKRHRNRYQKYWLRKKSGTTKKRPNKKRQTVAEPAPYQKWFMMIEGGIRIKSVTVNEEKTTHYACRLCNRAFSALIHLTRHERQAHFRDTNPDNPATDKKRFRCKYCDKTHHNKADLDYHERSMHTGETVIFTCDVCKATFKRKVYLNRHMRIHNDIRPYVCKVCGKSFVKGGGLKEHERTHTGEKPYKCSTCLRGFSGRANLRRHEMTHSGEQPFECKICGKRCNRIASLRQHMRIHTGERPYNCMHCNKAFPTCANLRRHERTHLEKKQFSCRQCGKEFTQKYTLKLHEMNHLGIRPHLCLLCGKTFMEKRKLRLHLSAQHGVVQTDESENSSQQYELDLAMEGGSGINSIPDSLKSNVMAGISDAHLKALEDFQTYWRATYLDNDSSSSDNAKSRRISQAKLNEHKAKQVENANKLEEIFKTLPPQNANLPNQSVEEADQPPIIPLMKLPEALVELARIDAAEQAVREAAKQAASNKVIDDLKQDSGVNNRQNGAPSHHDKPKLDSCSSKRRKIAPSSNPEAEKIEVSERSQSSDKHEDNGSFSNIVDKSNSRKKSGKDAASPSSLQVDHEDKQLPSQNGNSIFNRFNAMAGAFDCNRCGQTFTSQIVLEIHMRTHQREEFQSFCVQCNKSFSNILDLEDHIKSHDIPTSDREEVSNDVFMHASYSTQCNKTFDNNIALEDHIRTHDQLVGHSTSEASVGNIPNHVVSSSGVSSAPDESDGLVESAEVSTESSNWNSSKPKISEGGKLKLKDRVYPCPHCDKKYKKHRSLKEHLKTHEVGIVPVQCVANVDNLMTYSNAEIPSEGTDLDAVPNMLGSIYDSQDNAYESFDGVDVIGAPDMMHEQISNGKTFAEDMIVKSNSKQGLKKIWACKFCNMTFPIQQLLAGHMNKHRNNKARVQSNNDDDSDSEKPFSCHICSKAFSKQERLAGHMNKHKDNYIKKVPTEEEAIQKMDEVNQEDPDNQWRCPYCDTKLAQRAEIIEHLHEHVGVDDQAYTCEVCHKGFSKRANYMAHKVTHTTELKHQCEICKKMFKHLQSLKKHLIRCRTIFNCDQCDKSFTHKRLLNTHVWNTHHREETCKCKVCGKMMSSASGLREHELIHKGEKPYKCDICSRGFANRSNLRRHVMIHQNDRPFVCEFCKMTFNRLASLQQHERCHTGEKPYKCNVCGLSFASKSTARKHEMRHSKQKEIKCRFCERKFWDNYACRTHERIHTGDLPFECTLCNKKYPERNVLMKHMKTNHKEWYALNVDSGFKDNVLPNDHIDGEASGHSGGVEVNDDSLDEDEDRLLQPLSDDGDGGEDEDRLLQPLSDDGDEGDEDYNMSSDTDEEIKIPDNFEGDGMEDLPGAEGEVVS